jgi:AcrR family transcriptional regulator
MSSPLSKRQQRSATTSDQLLVAAREVFEARGFVATSVAAITEAANTAHGTFYLHFKNKEDVFARIMGDLTADLYREERPPRTADAFEVIELSIRDYFRVFDANRQLWRCLIEAIHHSAVIEDLWLGLRRPFVERFERRLEHVIALGAARPMDASVAAQALGSMVEWFAFVHFVLEQPPGAVRTLEEVAHSIADLWVHALFGRIDLGAPSEAPE